MMIVPTLTAIIGGAIMFFVLGAPLTAATHGLENFITGLDQTQKVFYGFMIVFIGCIDYGGGPSLKFPI